MPLNTKNNVTIEIHNCIMDDVPNEMEVYYELEDGFDQLLEDQKLTREGFEEKCNKCQSYSSMQYVLTSCCGLFLCYNCYKRNLRDQVFTCPLCSKEGYFYESSVYVKAHPDKPFYNTIDDQRHVLTMLFQSGNLKDGQTLIVSKIENDPLGVVFQFFITELGEILDKSIDKNTDDNLIDKLVNKQEIICPYMNDKTAHLSADITLMEYSNQVNIDWGTNSNLKNIVVYTDIPDEDLTWLISEAHKLPHDVIVHKINKLNDY